jgi:cytochrome c biogenesis protein CcdA
MVTTLLPMVHGSRKEIRHFPGLLLVHSLASTAGGLLIGLCIGYVSSLAAGAGFSSVFIGLTVGCVALLVALKEAGLVNIRLPESQWQVPRDWSVKKCHMLAAAFYGFFLGIGLLTRMSSCLYPVLVWSALQGRPQMPTIVMLLFGFCRTIPMWVLYFTSENRDPALCAVSLSHWQPAVRLLNACALVFLGSFFVTLSLPYHST